MRRILVRNINQHPGTNDALQQMREFASEEKTSVR